MSSEHLLVHQHCGKCISTTAVDILSTAGYTLMLLVVDAEEVNYTWYAMVKEVTYCPLGHN